MQIMKVFLLTMVLAVLAGCHPLGDPNLSPHHKPTDHPMTPVPRQDFQNYIEETESYMKRAASAHINTVLKDTKESEDLKNAASAESLSPLDYVIKRRSPFQFAPNCKNQTFQSQGVLLIHGLTDTPFLLRDIGEVLSEDCLLVRAILLPGHGTVPGDLLNVQYEDWIRSVETAVESFPPDVNAIHIVGFSTGTTLAVHYAVNHQPNMRVKKLVLLAPAIKPKTKLSALADWHQIYTWIPLLEEYKWSTLHGDEDLYKYESFPKNAGNQFHELAKETRGANGLQVLYENIWDKTVLDMPQLDMPVLIIASAEDETVSTEAARELFCERVTAGKRKMVIYRKDGEKGAENRCLDIEYRESSYSSLADVKVQVLDPDRKVQVLDFSHLSLPVDPENSHYGVGPNAYKNCLDHYDRFKKSNDVHEKVKWEECRGTKPSPKEWYGETSALNLNAYTVRRLTFNPDFKRVLEDIRQFLKQP